MGEISSIHQWRHSAALGEGRSTLLDAEKKGPSGILSNQFQFCTSIHAKSRMNADKNDDKIGHLTILTKYLLFG